MAKLLSTFTVSTLFLSALVSPITGEDYGYVKTFDRNPLKPKKEKLSHFRFYWQDVTGGPAATAITVLPPVNGSSTAFGMVNMIDDRLTEGPELGSKLVGRAQGFYGSASQQEVGLLMAMNFAFVDGKYNGSTITVLGRNPVFHKVREMPVVGGSGLFRFATGDASFRPHPTPSLAHEGCSRTETKVASERKEEARPQSRGDERNRDSNREGGRQWRKRGEEREEAPFSTRSRRHKTTSPRPDTEIRPN